MQEEKKLAEATWLVYMYDQVKIQECKIWLILQNIVIQSIQIMSNNLLKMHCSLALCVTLDNVTSIVIPKANH